MPQLNVLHICSKYIKFENTLNVGIARKDVNENAATKKLKMVQEAVRDNLQMKWKSTKTQVCNHKDCSLRA